MKSHESYEEKIKKVYSSLSASEERVADFVLSNGYAVSTMSLNKLSISVGVSEPTIIRFVKKIGCSGYSEFKMNLMKDWGRNSVSEKNENNVLVDLHINKDERLEDIPQKMIGITIKALEDTLNLIDIEKYSEAIELITNANVIDVYGVGNSGSIASDIMNKLIRIGLNCRAYPDNHVQQIYASHLTNKDVAIAISHSGNTIDTVNSLKIAKESGAKTIALTNFRGAAISQYADIVFYTGDVETTFYSETMASRMSQLAIVDMLYMGVLSRNYESFIKRLEKTNMLVKEKNY